MDLGALVQNLLGKAQPVHVKPLELHPGQVVRGIVVQAEEGGEAIVQINGVRVRVRLELPLPPGRSSLLMVQPESTPDTIVLKPLSASTQVPVSAASAEQLLTWLGLASTRANRQLLQWLHRCGVPLAPEHAEAYRQAAQVPSGVPAHQWHQAAAVAFRRHLPVRPETIGALREALFGPPLTERLLALSRSVAEAAAMLPAAEQGEAGMAGSVQLLRQGGRLLNRLLSYAAGGGSTAGDAAARAAADAASAPMPVAAQISPRAAADVVPRRIAADVPESSAQGAGRLGGAGGTAPGAAEMAYRALNRQTEASPSGGETLRSGSAKSVQGGNAAPQGEVPVRPGNMTVPVPAASNDASDAVPAATAPVATATAAASEVPAPSVNGGSWLAQMFKLLGLDYERQLVRAFITNPLLTVREAADSGAMSSGIRPVPGAEFAADSNSAALPAAGESLKTVLLRLAGSDEIPAAIREQAQQLVQHLTGQQLLMSADRGAAYSHFVWAIPIVQKDGQETAEVHIQARTRGQGELDADNCRLWFDLQLQHLGETIVDVQVTNRTVRVKVHNDRPAAPEWMNRHRGALETGLRSIGFELLSLTFEPLPERANPESPKTAERVLSALEASTSYKGVDLRI
jgi:hypothetical protein